MMRRIRSILLAACFLLPSLAKADDQSRDVTLFHEFRPAEITMASDGAIKRQRECNISLKNGALLFRQGGILMEAEPEQISSARFGERNFIKLGTQMAEVIDSCGANLLVLVRIINTEALGDQIRSKSNITHIRMGDVIGVARVEADPQELTYPVDNHYYFIVNGKPIPATDRYARTAAGRKRLQAYETVVRFPHFRWSDEACLLRVLEVLSK